MARKRRVRRLYRAVRRELRSGGRIALAGIGAGLGTYGALRMAAPAFRVTSKFLYKHPGVRRRIPSLIAATRRLGKKGTALEYGLASGAITGFGQLRNEAKKSAGKRYRRWAGI